MLMPPESLEIWVGLLRTQAAILDRLEESLRDEGISMAWFEVLARLGRAPDGAMRMQDLADQILLSKSGLTRLADRIEEAGDIERRACPSDRRGTFATITTQGRARYERVAPLTWEALETCFGSQLSPDEVTVLRDVFDRLSGAREEVHP